MPYFSVVLPTYNRAKWLPETIQSVLKQSFKDFELIVVDDGSTDETKEVIQKIADSRIRYVYQNNMERSAARNNGIRISKGRYICFLDSDDAFLPHHLQTFYEVIQAENEPDFLFSDIAEKNSIPQDVDSPARDPFWKQMTPSEAFRWGIFHPAGCMRWCVKKGLLENQNFNPKLHVGEDVELFLRLLNYTKNIFHIRKITVTYTEHSERTVNKINSYIKNLELIHYIYSTNPLAQKNVSLKNRWKHGNYMALARIFTASGAHSKALKSLFQAFRLDPFSNLKEKVYLFLKNISILR
ncbi:MAG: glycosyltransferase [Flavobacteriales bacterium]|nr:glycosyltransferase [Flavobacteriales bacterium]